MASILPDDVLNTLLCSICKKYLSCAPTKIHKNNGMSCGRCNTNETTGTNSLYEGVANFSLFPCVNRYEGCNKLFQYKDVAHHEKNCISTLISCPLCICDQQFSLLYLIDHYKTVHEKYFLKEPKFVIDTNTMSENIYLYCDDLNNCLFLVEISCTRDRLFLSAYVSKNNKVVERFRLNNVLLESNSVLLCSTLGEQKKQHIEVKVADEPNSLWYCEFLYDVIQKTVPRVALDLHSVEEPRKREEIYRKLPKIYLDNKTFSEKRKYKLSPCKSKLINEYDRSFKITLRCDICDTYFWNVPGWKKIVVDQSFEFPYRYGLYCTKNEELGEVICLMCYSHLYCIVQAQFKPTIKSIFRLGFYCRYNCETICSVFNLDTHESSCEYNFEKDSNEFVKNCFDKNSYNADDKFVIGNVVEPFDFEAAFYSFAIFGPKPKLQDSKDVTSPEKVIYLITDDGLKCKVYYKYEKGDFCVQVDHEYGRNRYIIKICLFTPEGDGGIKKIMYVEKSKYFTVGRCYLVTQIKPDGVAQYVKTPCFIVNIKKNSPSCSLIL